MPEGTALTLQAMEIIGQQYISRPHFLDTAARWVSTRHGGVSILWDGAQFTAEVPGDFEFPAAQGPDLYQTLATLVIAIHRTLRGEGGCSSS